MSEEKFKKVFEMNPLIIGVNGNFHRERSSKGKLSMKNRTRSSKCSFVFVIIILIQNVKPNFSSLQVTKFKFSKLH